MRLLVLPVMGLDSQLQEGRPRWQERRLLGGEVEYGGGETAVGLSHNPKLLVPIPVFRDNSLA